MRHQKDMLEALKQRGFVQETSDDDSLRALLRRESIRPYCGYDATATSLHVGSLLSIMLMANLQLAGHRPIILMGGGTTRIGDPSGKAAGRALLSQEQIAQNLAGIRQQFGRFLDFSSGGATMVDNADWLLGLNYIDFLRDIGRHFTVNRLLQHETYKQRVRDDGLSFIEFNYVLLQAYDFLHLWREFGCVLQLGGSDQWFNILSGIDLIRRTTGGQAFGLVSPLIQTSSGGKMGKTERGAVWLDAELTSPFAYYQFWRNTEDADVVRFLRLFTFVPIDEIERLAELEGAELRHAKQVLALEATSLCHGPAAAEAARSASLAAFGGQGEEALLPTVTFARQRLSSGVTAAQLLVEAGMCASRGAAKRLIEQGGASINDQRLQRADELIDGAWLTRETLLIRTGKKRVMRMIVG
jgi:tyrosyl-tRNA synthetase